MKKIKILVNGLSDNNGGIETCVLNYCGSLVKEGISVDFMTTNNSIARSDQIAAWGGVLHTVTRLSRNPIKHIKEVTKILFSGSYDAVWDNRDSLNNPVFLILAKKAGISIRIIHGHTMNNLGGNLRQLLHILNRQFMIRSLANRYWAASEASADYFFGKHMVAEGRVTIIPNCIDYSEFLFDDTIRKLTREKWKVSDNDKVIIMVGNLAYPKNQELIISALYDLHISDPTWKLILVGRGVDEEKLKRRVLDLKLEKNVIFSGMLPSVSDLLQASDIFVMASFHEGLAIAFVEAQVSGLPCVISNTIPKEAYICDNNYTVSPFESSKIWADKIQSVYGKRHKPTYIDDGQTRYDLKCNGRKLIQYILK